MVISFNYKMINVCEYFRNFKNKRVYISYLIRTRKYFSIIYFPMCVITPDPLRSSM